MPVNLQISDVQFSLHTLHCLTCKRFLVSLCKLCTFKLVLIAQTYILLKDDHGKLESFHIHYYHRSLGIRWTEWLHQKLRHQSIYASYSGRLHNIWIVGSQIYSKVNSELK